MDTSTIIAVVAVVVVLVVAVLAVRPLLRRRRLQERFGPEYDRAVDSRGDRSAAEHELIEREKRYKEFDLRPLAPDARDRYATRWTEVQAQFVDEPQAAVADADRLLTEVMAERGYPTGGFEQQAADLSVEHGGTMQHYRAAHDIHQRAGDGRASTEDLREAMVHYRFLFVELLGTEGDDVDADARGRAGDRVDATRLGTDRDRLDTERERVDAERDRVDADRVDTVRDRDGRDGRDGRYADRGDGAVSDTVSDAQRDTTDQDVDAKLADAERGRTGRHHTSR